MNILIASLRKALSIRMRYYACPECNAQMSNGKRHNKDCQFYIIEEESC